MRSSLQKNFGALFRDGDKDGEANIDGDVLHALLHIRRYEHGSRSMQAVLDMSRLVDAKQFSASMLPSIDQLNMHVDSKQFMELLKEVRRDGRTGPDLYHRLDEHPELQSIFYRYMSSWTSLAVHRMLACVDLSGVKSAVDVGGGDGTAAITIAQAYPQMQIEVIELPDPTKIARARIAATQIAQRVRVTSADFFEHEFPVSVDCFFFVHLLVIWPLETVVELLRRAYRSLRPGGKVVILNSTASDADDGPLVAALDTAYFVSLPACGGMIYSWSDFERCLEQAGFAKHYRVELGLWTPQGVIVAEKH